ncbi:ABC transporter permease subunit [Streptosporangium sp. NPDC051022]|uniref:ABC transporter permease n=1 Tax=Streptosporangium sp. NPDC051022 TaxID=3155752 RepID=UPI00342BB4CE
MGGVPRPPAGRASLPARMAGRPAGFSWVDAVVAAALLAVLYVVIRVGRGTTVSFTPAEVSTIGTDPAKLPYYAVRSLLRMYAALALSLVFTLVWAYAAAHSRRAERVLIPALDILQSVPVPAFLAVAVTGFVGLFPGSLFGLECAAVFAIFTSQAWNMTFAFYHSLITTPRELVELSRSVGFTRWMRFWKVELPSGAIPLVWNGMMSFGGGWFFLVASELISVSNREYTLPGVGSYAGAAIAAGNLGDMAWAVLTMAIMVIGVNFLFWRPLVAWAERFKVEQSEAAQTQHSLVLDFLRRSRWPRLLGRTLVPVRDLAGRLGRVFGMDDRPLQIDTRRRRTGDVVFALVVIALIAWGLVSLAGYLAGRQAGLSVFVEPILLGLATLARVVVLVVLATLVWVPIGVKIGLSPRLTRIAQPTVQVLAGFPANFLFPLATWLFLKTGVSIDLGGILLMALGAQWYILFNAIAGAMAIPTDLREAMDNLGVYGRQRWKHLIIPGIFPAYITGGITASGGAWNASIVSEVVTFGGTTLTATGLGAYIAQATQTGDYPHLIAGVTVMSLYVVGLNRLFWRRLYKLAETRYAL